MQRKKEEAIHDIYLKFFSEKCLEFDNELKGNDTAKRKQKQYV